ncbi:hypothetical protein ACVWXO_008483 [Bradyrhizobium sp. LM2.7]
MASSYRARPGPASRAGFLPVSRKTMSESPSFVSSWERRRNKGSANETISRAREDVRKLAMVTNPANK